MTPGCRAKIRSEAYFGAVIVISLIFVLHYYHGIIHDARLYSFLALLDLNPARFQADLFAANDTQRAYNGFGLLFAALIDAFGLSLASKLVVVAGLLAWVSGAWHLARRMVRPRGLRLGMTLAAVAAFLPYSVFQTSEAFATPRLFAEALGLHAVALAVAGRPWAGVAVSLGVAVLHPLMAPACLAVVILLAARSDRRWLLLIPAGAAAVAGLAWADLGPFAALGRRMDPAWLAIVHDRAAYLFATRWPHGYWSALIVQGAVLVTLLLSRVLSRPGRPAGAVYGLGLGVGLAGLIGTVIGADLLADIFLIQVQPWRALWLTSVLAHMAAAHGAWLLWRRGFGRGALLAGWAGLAVGTEQIGAAGVAAVSILLAWMTLDALGPRRLTTGPRGRLIMGGVMVVAGTWLGLLALASALGVMAEADSKVPVLRDLPLFWLACSVAAFLLLRRVRRPTVRQAVCLITMTVTLTTWDQRAPWVRHIETASAPPEVLAALPEGQPVYWPGAVTAVWFLLRRPSYTSYEQGAGVAFDPLAAQAFRHRMDQVAALTSHRQTTIFPRVSPSERGNAMIRPVTVADVRATCARTPSLATIILIHNLPVLRPLRWDLAVPFTFPVSPNEAVPDWRARSVYLYDCDRAQTNLTK
jgi:hypothetical protein